jgi:hypothetical protein
MPLWNFTSGISNKSVEFFIPKINKKIHSSITGRRGGEVNAVDFAAQQRAKKKNPGALRRETEKNETLWDWVEIG